MISSVLRWVYEYVSALLFPNNHSPQKFDPTLYIFVLVFSFTLSELWTFCINKS